ncbi:hypothetical protein SDC9_24662 [bioreactor metagenome]|uniref:HNH nuclease domain-containing protein n=1 Tax=bioreactor metagenome TaxID=1076179 RepID=A0A644UIY8_9ZZZZ|nr:HNH endonuclease signature motif containing protein [Desulfitobacterium hafniense]MEA5025953.1 HNH endonuclease signature motif containing protein [Desulfitobacterium hafniense]
MKNRKFKEHDIIISSPPHRTTHSAYSDDLERDFSCRCAYCNLHKNSVTTPFEVDHFIPRAVFKGIRDDLNNDYRNLVYACKKCNGAKSSKFSGDIKSENPTNNSFYDPRQVDYNTIFYRNDYGAIVSNDAKGRSMIRDIKLYRPIHTMGWLCEKLASMVDKLDVAISYETNCERLVVLQQARDKICYKYFQYERVFKASYNEPDFSVEGLEALGK